MWHDVSASTKYSARKKTRDDDPTMHYAGWFTHPEDAESAVAVISISWELPSGNEGQRQEEPTPTRPGEKTKRIMSD
jgi:hypothetical protein